MLCASNINLNSAIRINGNDDYTGYEEMFLIAAFSSTPAKVFTPEGEEMSLPWQAR